MFWTITKAVTDVADGLGIQFDVVKTTRCSGDGYGVSVGTDHLIVDCQEGQAVVADETDLVVHAANVEVLTGCEDFGPVAPVVSKANHAGDQLDLDKVVVAAVVGVEEDSIRNSGHELELDGAVAGRVPFAELSV